MHNVWCMYFQIRIKLELERLCSEDTRPMITHTIES